MALRILAGTFIVSFSRIVPLKFNQERVVVIIIIRNLQDYRLRLRFVYKGNRHSADQLVGA